MERNTGKVLRLFELLNMLNNAIAIVGEGRVKNMMLPRNLKGCHDLKQP